MKLLTLIIAVAVLSVYAQEGSQTPEDFNQVKAEIQAEIGDIIDNMPAEVQAKVQAAVMQVEDTQKQLEAMKKKGKTDEELKQYLNSVQEQAEIKLTNAIANMEGASEKVKAQVEQVRAEIQNRINQKKQELKKLQGELE